jgi:hypothetical protein
MEHTLSKANHRAHDNNGDVPNLQPQLGHQYQLNHEPYPGYTFSDIYHAAMNDRDFDYVFWIDVAITLAFQNFMRFMGTVLVVVAVALICFFTFAGFAVILPGVATPGTLWHGFNVCWGTELTSRS